MWKWREQRGYRGGHKGAEWLQTGTQGSRGATDGDTREQRGYRGGHKWRGYRGGHKGGGATEGNLSWQPVALVTHMYTHTRARLLLSLLYGVQKSAKSGPCCLPYNAASCVCEYMESTQLNASLNTCGNACVSDLYT